jgi:hypothetical protein
LGRRWWTQFLRCSILAIAAQLETISQSERLEVMKTLPNRRARRIVKLTLVLAFVSLSVRAALATGELVNLIKASDATRLKSYETVRAEAISEAKAGGTAKDLSVLEAVLSGTPRSFHGNFSPVGLWKCRTLKLGGLLPLTVYPRFKCRISDDGSGWRLEKLSGSQRSSGRLYDDGDTRLIYLGTLHYGEEKPRSYGDDPERDQVAYVFRPSENRLRLEFPLPKYESKLDILELTR